MKNINFIWIIISGGIVLLGGFLFPFIAAMGLTAIYGPLSEDMILNAAVIGSYLGYFSGTLLSAFFFKKTRILEPIAGAALVIVASTAILVYMGATISPEIVLGTFISLAISLAGAFTGLWLRKRRAHKSMDDKK